MASGMKWDNVVALFTWSDVGSAVKLAVAPRAVLTTWVLGADNHRGNQPTVQYNMGVKRADMPVTEQTD